MENLKESFVCENCGEPCHYFRKGMTHGWKCLNCGWNLVTSYNPLSELPNDFEIRIEPKSDLSSDGYKFLSSIMGLNYINLRNAVGSGPLVVNGNIFDSLKIIEMLQKLDIQFQISPEYPFQPEDEMYQKIKTDTVFDDDFIE